MISIIICTTIALIGLIGLNTPDPGLTGTGTANHRRKYLTWIVLSIGLGAASAIIESGIAV